MAKLSLRGAKGTAGGGKSKAKAARKKGGNTAVQKKGYAKALAMYPELFGGGGGSYDNGPYVDRSSEF